MDRLTSFRYRSPKTEPNEMSDAKYSLCGLLMTEVNRLPLLCF
jgi:hypothetical protein